jgi:hypothetical protein
MWWKWKVICAYFGMVSRINLTIVNKRKTVSKSVTIQFYSIEACKMTSQMIHVSIFCKNRKIIVTIHNTDYSVFYGYTEPVRVVTHGSALLGCLQGRRYRKLFSDRMRTFISPLSGIIAAIFIGVIVLNVISGPVVQRRSNQFQFFNIKSGVLRFNPETRKVGTAWFPFQIYHT